MSRRALPLLAWALVGLMGLLWWSTAASTSVARIAAMQVVEPYAFAVYHQIVHNLAMDGDFVQTVHQGYDDSWTWSGHRAPALFPVAALYRLDPTVYGLARVQILLVMLGAIPAALIARRAAGSELGVPLGAALYLFSPPVLALALQDYQDLVLALPCLVFAVWAWQADRWAWLPLGVVAGLLPREETVPVVLILAVLTIPWASPASAAATRVRWKRWALNIGVTALIVGAYVGGVETFFPSTGTQYKTPLVSVIQQLGGPDGRVHLDGWPWMGSFYGWLLVPLGLLALGAPQLALPAAGLVLFHLAMPQGNAIDRSWQGHSHHLAPAVAVLLAAAAEGGGRLLRLAGHARLGRVGRLLPVALAVALLLLIGSRFRAQALDQNLRLTLLPQNPAWVHPAWPMALALPEDAVPAVARDLSPMVSNRRVAYTYDGSLDSKELDRGLGAATHALIDARQGGGRVTGWVRAMPGSQKLQEAGPYSLWTWDAGAEDPSWEQMQEVQIRKEQPWISPYRRREDIPGVARFVSPERPAGARIPVIPLPRWLFAWLSPGPAPRPGVR